MTTKASNMIEAVMAGTAEAMRFGQKMRHESEDTGRKLRVAVIDHVLTFGLTIAHKLRMEGHHVAYCPTWGPQSDSPYMEFLGRDQGFQLWLPDGWMSLVDGPWPEVATVTGTEHRGFITTFLRQHAKIPTVSAGHVSAKLELDRGYGLQMAREAGIKVPWQRDFKSLEDVRDFLEKGERKGRYVLKLDQTLRAAGETLVACEDDSSDLISGLNKLEAKLGFAAGLGGFYLQEFVKGTEVAMTGWFNGKKLVGDRLFVCYDAASGFAYDFRLNGLSLVGSIRLEQALSSIGFQGLLDINGVLTDNGEFHFLEWTPRWGSGMTEFVCHATPNLGQLLHAVATGREAPVLRPELNGQQMLVVNARELDAVGGELPISLGEGIERLPVFSPQASFWCDNAIQTKDGKWISLPINQSDSRRARYVGVAGDLEDAATLVDKLADKVSIADCIVETAQAVKSLQERVEAIYTFIKNPTRVP